MYRSPDARDDENSRKQNARIDLRLVGAGYSQYQANPQNYLLQRIKKDNPWPQIATEDIASFLRSISDLYNPVAYHNLTHAFDVMVNLDSYLTVYGWQQRLQISGHKRIFMLIAAYAHDGGHQGLTNAFYKNSNDPLSQASQSPLEYMHISHLRRILREHQIEVAINHLEDMIEMILRTDNYYHGWLIQKCNKLKGETDNSLRSTKHTLTVCSLLLHAADLNNTCKDTEISVLWTQLLYEEFDHQTTLERKRGLKVSSPSLNSNSDKAKSNIYFLDHLVIPLYKGIAQLQPKFGQLLKKIGKNKVYWQSMLSQR